jgi:hypothetical protein
MELKIMKCVLSAIAMIIASLLSSLSLVIADDTDMQTQGTCDLRGNWVGSFVPAVTGNPGIGKFMVTYGGPTRNSGTDVLEAINIPPELIGIHQDASLSTARGMWKRISGRKFSFILILYGVDPTTGLVMASNKSFGIKTLSADCNSMEVALGMKLYGPDEDPASGSESIQIMDLNQNEVRAMMNSIRLDSDGKVAMTHLTSGQEMGSRNYGLGTNDTSEDEGIQILDLDPDVVLATAKRIRLD